MSKVSVIIPTYNRPESLRVAVQSVLDQETEGIEIIIINDNSDKKCEVQLDQILDLGKNIHLVNNQNNLGVAACRNIGIDKSCGEYILFLDDDDILFPEMIKQSLRGIQQKGVELVSCRSQVLGSHISSKKLKSYNSQQQENLNIYDLSERPMEHIFLYHPQIHTFLVKKAALSSLRFREDLDYGEDILFWLELAWSGAKFEKLNFVGCQYSIHPEGASSQINYNSKLTFYSTLADIFPLSPAFKSIRNLKMTFLGIKNLDIHFLIWGAKLLLRPALCIKHVRYFLRRV